MATRLRLIGYVRVSTEGQARDGVSLKAQRERLAAYCAAHGAELVGIESDNGTSGKVPPLKRPGLATALTALRDGEADGLLVLKLDRLSRRTRDVLDLVDDARSRRWRLVSVDERLDTGSAAGRMVLTVLAALAEMEREQVSERTRLGMDQVAREGRARSRFTPFGYRTADGGTEQRRGDRRPLVADRAERRLLLRIEQLRGDGLGARRIAANLNSRGITNPRTGRAWTYRTVERLLGTADRRRHLAA